MTFWSPYSAVPHHSLYVTERANVLTPRNNPYMRSTTQTRTIVSNGATAQLEKN